MRPVRRVIRDISSVLILAGLLLVLDAGATLVWQEPVTAAIGLVLRGQVNDRYLSYRTAPLSSIDRAVLTRLQSGPDRVSFLARRLSRQVRTGDAVGSISIPAIGVGYTIVQGTDELSLEKGPGHYPGTALPGLGRTVAIAGHRTTYLAPFRRINELHHGDRIVLRMPYGRFVYRVQHTQIVLPTALWVTRDVGYDRLVLSACNPLYSAAQRIIVFARLASETPLGPA
ncbi:MAG TPA: class E sortase [Solirubrobacteraceae bacterium]|nr:class E sortase [Solirubrobacteraceae bacterium]